MSIAATDIEFQELQKILEESEKKRLTFNCKKTDFMVSSKSKNGRYEVRPADTKTKLNISQLF